ncbi:hypothetical protein [Neomesorhizobium albiziae]|nr:hypothetical protein [Mesorhizobium albiziae]GLS30723.1 hypothetical protein GCM10007937_24310 [Mesorhizobium albiziae]
MAVLLLIPFMNGLQQWEKRGDIRDFLNRKSSGLTREYAFGASNEPAFAEPNFMHNLTISLQYLFGFLWKILGFDWNHTRYVVGGLVAATVLSSFLFVVMLGLA